MKTIHLTRRELVMLYTFSSTQAEQDGASILAEKPLCDLLRVKSYISIINNKLRVIVKGDTRS